MTESAQAQHYLNINSPTANNPALICGSKTLSYAQFLNAVVCAEGRLRDSGVEEYDRVGIKSPNSIEYIIALFALWRIGAVACLISTRLPEKSVDEQLTSTQCPRLLTYDDLIHISGNPSINEKSQSQDFCIHLDQDATVIFTSGTSFKPKAALHTYGNHYYNALGSNGHIPVVPGDQWLLSLPLYHVGGLGIIFRTFLGGSSVVIPESNEPIEETLKKQRITHLSLVPTQLIRLIHNKDCHSLLKKLKVILLGGSNIPGSLITNAIELGLPVYTTYGLTEMASQVATSSRLSKDNSVSAGKILNYRKLLISEEGEILVKGETLFKGYIEHTRIVSPFNKNGYFATGDLGLFQDNGNLMITGRKDNMFISGGENIQPEEIEKHLCELANVERAIIVPICDDEFGSSPVAVIKTKGGSRIEQSKIVDYLLKFLPKFKIPKQFYIWPEAMDPNKLKDDRHEIAQFIKSPNSCQVL